MSILLYQLLAEFEFDTVRAAPPPPPPGPPAEVAALGMRARCAPANERAAGCLLAGSARPAREPHVLSYTVPAGAGMDFVTSLCEQTGARLNDTQRAGWCLDNGRVGPRCLKYLAQLVKREQPIVLLPAALPACAAPTRRDLVDLPRTSAFLIAGAPGSIVGSLVVLATGDACGGKLFGVGVVKDRAFFNDVGFRTLRDQPADHDLLVPVQLVTVFEDLAETNDSIDERLAFLIRSVPAVVTPADDAIHTALPRPFGLWLSADALSACLLNPNLVAAAVHPDLEVSVVPQRVFLIVRMAIACAVFMRFLPHAGAAGSYIAGNFVAATAAGTATAVRCHVRRHTTAKCLEHIAKRTATRDFTNAGLCAAFEGLAFE